MGMDLLDPQELPEFLYPRSTEIPAISDFETVYNGPDHPNPGSPANPRTQASYSLYLQLGTYLDYYTGEHEPSLSRTLREAAAQGSDTQELAKLVPKTLRPLFPQLNVDASWPPSFLVHGEADTAVRVGETKNMALLLRDAGVEVELRLFKGSEHGFDDPRMGGNYVGLFDDAAAFLLKGLKS